MPGCGNPLGTSDCVDPVCEASPEPEPAPPTPVAAKAAAAAATTAAAVVTVSVMLNASDTKILLYLLITDKFSESF